MQTRIPFPFLNLFIIGLLLSMGCGEPEDGFDDTDVIDLQGPELTEPGEAGRPEMSPTPEIVEPPVAETVEVISQPDPEVHSPSNDTAAFMDRLFDVPVSMVGVSEGTVIAAEVFGRLKLAFFDENQALGHVDEYELIEGAQWSLLGDGQTAALIQVFGDDERTIEARFIYSNGTFDAEVNSAELEAGVYFSVAYEFGTVIVSTVTGNLFQRNELRNFGPRDFRYETELPISHLDDPIETMVTNGRSTIIRHASGAQVSTEVGRCSINANQLDDVSYDVDESFIWHAGTQRFWSYDGEDNGVHRFIGYGSNGDFREVDVQLHDPIHNVPTVVAGTRSLKIAYIFDGRLMITDVQSGESISQRLEHYAHRVDVATVAPDGDAIIALTTGRPNVDLIRIPLAE